MEEEVDGLHQELIENISKSRREILWLVESTYGTTTQWAFVRSQLLRILGDGGLEGLVKKLMGGMGYGSGTDK